MIAFLLSNRMVTFFEDVGDAGFTRKSALARDLPIGVFPIFSLLFQSCVLVFAPSSVLQYARVSVVELFSCISRVLFGVSCALHEFL